MIKVFFVDKDAKPYESEFHSLDLAQKFADRRGLKVLRSKQMSSKARKVAIL